MDTNKEVILKENGFKIRKTCSMCKYFVAGLNMFGTCMKYEYEHEHLKHKRIMQLTAHGSGWCNGFEENLARKCQIGKYDIFLEK